MIDEENCMVPFWGTPSPEVDSLLSESFVTSSSCEEISSNSEWPPERVLGREQEDLTKWIHSLEDIGRGTGEGRISSSSRSSGGISSDFDDGSYLEKFMNVYGISVLDENDCFYMEDAAVTIQQEEKSDDSLVIVPMKVARMEEIEVSSMFFDDASLKSPGFCNNTMSETFPVKEYGIKRKANSDALIARTDPETKLGCSNGADIPFCHFAGTSVSTASSVDRKKKFITAQSGSDYISERKREQNRYAAIRYRDKCRKKVTHLKEELHELELRNVQLKTEFEWLSKEVAYLKNLVKLTYT